MTMETDALIVRRAQAVGGAVQMKISPHIANRRMGVQFMPFLEVKKKIPMK